MNKTASILLILTLAVSISSALDISNAAVNQLDEWVPWTPAPGSVELHYMKIGSISYVNFYIDLDSPAYLFSSMGVPTIAGNKITVNAEIWHWTGMAPMVMGSYNYTYDLGSLPTGDYIFDFLVWEFPVKEITFSVALTLPRLEVDPYYSYIRGGFATINITIQGIEASDHFIGLGFRLSYYPTVLGLSDLTEGPFMQDPRWNLHGTMFIIEFHPIAEGNVYIGDLLAPDENGVWTVFPEGNGVLATLRFQAVSNVTSQIHIWTWVSLLDVSCLSDRMESIDISSIGGWVCLLEEAAADVVMDGRVDMKDLATVAKRFGSSLGDNRWSPKADVNGDNRIDMKDLSFVANQWGNNFEVPEGIPWVPWVPWPPEIP